MESTKESDMRVVIVGAGIGGLTAALSLHAIGVTDVVVVEKATELKPLGVGINLLPHAVRELTELGLGERLATIGVAPSTLTYTNRFGQEIWSEPRGAAAGYRWPQISVHRGEFQMALAAEVIGQLGADAILLGHSLVRMEHGDGYDTAVLKTAANDTVRVDADIVIGADGIHSAVRRQLHPGAPGPKWNGLTMWRGTALIEPYLDGSTMIMAGDDDQKFVAYPIGERQADGRARVNFIAEKRVPGSLESVDWNNEVPLAPIRDLFATWRFDWLDIPSLIGSAERVLQYPMADLDPLTSWTEGRTTLLGDAAHAMYPNGSNGSSQAILDARTLAFHIAETGAADLALAAYEADRRPATTALLESTRRTGPERVMVLARERAPLGFRNRDEIFAEGELAEIAAAYKRSAGFDPEALNRRASLTPSRPVL
ncbi:flavin-dependent oxidoreductase [Leifsonia xyli]|uniref:flavin-dependent oxidoreductase n=1 Tax=Leifsonia xyli TaxID=1575 RepID=UPI003D67919D